MNSSCALMIMSHKTTQKCSLETFNSLRRKADSLQTFGTKVRSRRSFNSTDQNIFQLRQCGILKRGSKGDICPLCSPEYTPA